MCKCGCGTCETIRGPLLTEGKVKVKVKVKVQLLKAEVQVKALFLRELGCP